MKKIFVIDWSLIPVFVLSAYSGIELHVADYEGNHEVWHNWAVFHVLTSLLFLMASIFHIATHWGWYKGTAKNGIGRKSKVTAVLSILVPVRGSDRIRFIGHRRSRFPGRAMSFLDRNSLQLSFLSAIY